MHFCHIAASCLLMYISSFSHAALLQWLHYGSIRGLVPSENSSTHLFIANIRRGHTADSGRMFLMDLSSELSYALIGPLNIRCL